MEHIPKEMDFKITTVSILFKYIRYKNKKDFKNSKNST